MPASVCMEFLSEFIVTRSTGILQLIFFLPELVLCVNDLTAERLHFRKTSRGQQHRRNRV